ncbi:MAG TPA: sulfotransferase [Conexibacter sp.]|nr:sulfotransferase [Conexibacter sp.]
MTREAASPRRAVVVLGFHRSGTSMVTRMLNLLGVDLGDESELLPPQERDNARGYWEPRWMIEFNEQLLEQLGSSTFEQFTPEPGWERSEQLDPLRERARALLDEHLSRMPLWGWKDPRTSLTLPFWRTVVDGPMSFVICMRSPADAVTSALERSVAGLDRWSYAERWLDYTAGALANTAPDERMLVFYEDALRDPAAETLRLAAFLGRDAPAAEQLEEIVASVDPELRHHQTSALDVAVDEGLPVETRTLYLLLRARRDLEAANGAGPAAARTAQALERIGAAQSPLHLTTLAAAAERISAEEQAARLTTRIDELEREHEQLRTQLTSEIATRDAALGELRGELAAHEEARSRDRGELAARDEMIVERDRLIAERDAQIATYRDSHSWRLTRPLRLLAERTRQRTR